MHARQIQLVCFTAPDGVSYEILARYDASRSDLTAGNWKLKLVSNDNSSKPVTPLQLPSSILEKVLLREIIPSLDFGSIDEYDQYPPELDPRIQEVTTQALKNDYCYKTLLRLSYRLQLQSLTRMHRYQVGQSQLSARDTKIQLDWLKLKTQISYQSDVTVIKICMNILDTLERADKNLLPNIEDILLAAKTLLK